MKNKVKLFLVMFLGMLLCGCGMQIENDIVFICNRQQYNDSYVNKGYFIDKNGYKGYFDLSNEGIDYANIDVLYSYLAEHCGEIETVPFMEEQEVLECYRHLCQVDLGAEIQEECVMADYGSYIFYGIRLSEEGDVEVIMLEEYGDWNRINSDKAAKEIMDIFGKEEWRE